MKLGKGFINLTEGERQTLEITKVSYDDKFDKAKVTFRDERGGTCTEQFIFSSKGKVNEVALNIFTTLAMCAFNNFKMQEVEFDPQELVGRSIMADVTKDIVPNEDTGRTNIYYHVRNFKVADGVETVEFDIPEAEEDDDDWLDDDE